MEECMDRESRALRIVREADFTVEASPEIVFPLLCPVREREWIPGWQADIVYSASGLVEDNCVFRSPNPKLGEGLYVTTRHEPDHGLVEFVVFYPGICVMRLDIAATAEGKRTHLRWRRTYTSLGAQGDTFIEGLTEAVFREQVAALKGWLGDYCRQVQQSNRAVE
jgi:hypothetical protein